MLCQRDWHNTADQQLCYEHSVTWMGNPDIHCDFMGRSQPVSALSSGLGGKSLNELIIFFLWKKSQLEDHFFSCTGRRMLYRCEPQGMQSTMEVKVKVIRSVVANFATGGLIQLANSQRPRDCRWVTPASRDLPSRIKWVSLSIFTCRSFWHSVLGRIPNQLYFNSKHSKKQ